MDKYMKNIERKTMDWSKGHIQLKDSKFCMQRWFDYKSCAYQYVIWRMNWGGFFLTEKSFTDLGINIKDFNGIVKTSNQLVFTTEEDVKKAVKEYMSKAGRI